MTHQGVGVLEKFLLTPSVQLSILAAVIGQLLMGIWWVRGESARISRLEELYATFRFDIDNLRTPLSVRVISLENKFEEMRRGDERQDRADLALAGRVENMDREGTRALDPVKQNQQRVMTQVDRLGDRILLIDSRLPSIQSQIDALKKDAEQIAALKKEADRIAEQNGHILKIIESRRIPIPSLKK